jgi:hypothetical protein
MTVENTPVDQEPQKHRLESIRDLRKVSNELTYKDRILHMLNVVTFGAIQETPKYKEYLILSQERNALGKVESATIKHQTVQVAQQDEQAQKKQEGQLVPKDTRLTIDTQNAIEKDMLNKHNSARCKAEIMEHLQNKFDYESGDRAVISKHLDTMNRWCEQNVLEITGENAYSNTVEKGKAEVDKLLPNKEVTVASPMR